MLMAGAISIDMSHHWYDILAGAILGSCIALLCYKNTYAAVFNYRRNHIPLSNTRRMSKERLDMLEERYYDTRLGFPVFPKETTLS
ncbi:hypothetical protein ABW19_dt0201679 [Dactylella cylindrospora]|nr:hypothetical protein ABW19_dt0201679 [Dactylella cylindrospora]